MHPNSLMTPDYQLTAYETPSAAGAAVESSSFIRHFEFGPWLYSVLNLGFRWSSELAFP